MIRLVRRLLVVSLGLSMIGAAPAGADPAGPTNYLSSIDSVEPASDAFEATIVGGDSFLLLEQVAPVLIEVPGYSGEPYLRYLPDGTVERNLHSPATYLNSDRYGNAETSDLPTEASADAVPEWEVVADDGVYAWHDHRAHWMLTLPPLGLGPGDQILDDVIPIEVDGDPIDLGVVSFWQPAPSPLSAIVGALIAIAVGVMAWTNRRLLPLCLMIGAVPALIVGASEFVSLPSATEPSTVLWVLPTFGAVASIGGWLSRGRPANSIPLVIGGAAALIVFGWTRLDGLTNAILPTDLPFWFDRLATTLSFGVGLAVAVLGALEFRTILMTSPVREASTR